MDMSGFNRFLPGSEDRAQTKALAIAAFHDHCFINADTPDPSDVADSIKAYFDHPDETAKAILRQASFSLNDVQDHAATIEDGSERHARLVRLHADSFQDDGYRDEPPMA